MIADPEELLRRYRQLDSCTVSDALDALDDGEGGTVPQLRPLWEGAQVVGRAVTMLLLPGPPAGPGPHLGARAIEAGGAGDVIVIANGGRTGMGAWGGLLSLAAAQRGVGGVVADGAIRDVDEARQLGFPAFALGPTVRTARGRVHEESVGTPVKVGGVLVDPGDLVIADGSGVVIVSWARAGAVLAKGEEIHQRELAMADLLRDGAPPTKVLGQAYESMLSDATRSRQP